MKKLAFAFMAIGFMASCSKEQNGISPVIYVDPIGKTFESTSGDVYLFGVDYVNVNGNPFDLKTRGTGLQFSSPAFDCESFYITSNPGGIDTYALVENDGDVIGLRKL